MTVALLPNVVVLPEPIIKLLNAVELPIEPLIASEPLLLAMLRVCVLSARSSIVLEKVMPPLLDVKVSLPPNVIALL